MDSKRERPSVGWTAVAVVAMVLLYPLSYGPVYGLYVHGFLPISVYTLSAVYAPVISLMNNFEPFGDFMRWYLRCWTP